MTIQKNSIQEIRESIRFFRVYGQLYHIQNLEWSDLFLKGLFHNVLRKKVMEYPINVPDIEKVDSLFYKVMMMIITSYSEEAMLTLTLKDYFYSRRKRYSHNQSTMRSLQKIDVS